MANNYKGTCFCGEVEIMATGAPAVMGYCHCEDCQAWSAAPINAFSLWAPDAVKVTRGKDKIGTYNKTPNSYRKFCKTCGGHLMTDHPGMKLVDVYANILQGFKHVPAVHVHYDSKMLSVKDGLPKFADLPAEFGGSGKTMAD
jgi:hypothetical protein